MFSVRITGLVLKSLFKKPATRRYPFVVREPFARTRGGIEIDIAKCTLCTLCQKRCPTEAIIVDREKKFWSIYRIKCIACNACVEACPTKCLSMMPKYAAPAVGLKGKADSYQLFQKPEEAPKDA
jgi:ech hydrogenase subunit F